MYWLIMFGLGAVVGAIAKAIHPGPDPVGFLPTALIGIVGMYVGGYLQFLMGKAQFGSPAGFVFGIIGSVIALAAWRWWNLQAAPSGPRTFLRGKLK